MRPLGPVFPAGVTPGYELAIPESPAAPGWREAPWRNINDWIHLADGVNDEAAFVAALAETDYLMVAPKQGGGDWTIPFTYSDNNGGGAVPVASGKTIKGLNKHAKIHCTGGNVETNDSIFDVHGPKVDIIFEDLYLYGDNGTTPGTFTYVQNKQSNAIFQHTNPSSEQPCDITVRGCTFEYLWGFPVHNTGGANTKRCHVIGCKVRYCANGLNMNAAFSIQAFNDVLHSEGFETTGEGTITYANLIREGIGCCIAQGGAGAVQKGQIVALNYCFADETLGGEALSLGDGFIDSIVIANTCRPAGAAGYYGMDFRNAFGATYQPARLKVTSNIILMDASTSVGIRAAAKDSSYDGNMVYGNSNVPLIIDASGSSFMGNHLPLGSGTPRAFQMTANATDILFDASNQYAPFAWFDASSGSATFRDGSFLRLTSKPTASSIYRGVTLAVRGGAGVADSLDICNKDSGDAYAWRSLF